MAGTGDECERIMTALAEALHDMCQPLTALYCRLEIGQIKQEAAAPGGNATVWTDSLRECARLAETVAAMRALLQQARANQYGRKK
jgi:hypothetical protein